jgi:glycosyltransferase involved in cell wall biosynthesis
MSKYFAGLVISFLSISIINIVWMIAILIILSTRGIYYLLQDNGILASIAISPILKWILLIDVSWIILFLIYVYSRKKFKADSEDYFLQYDPIKEPKICVVIPAFNEELAIENVVKSYIEQKSVSEVLVIDNHSEDNTVELARKQGAKVITKNENRGYEHSWVMGLREAAESDANLIVITEADGTLAGEDLDKMLPYIQHCDVIHGSRQVQLLTEDGNLRQEPIHIWGNYILSKIIQLKYLNMIHLGIVNLNDIGTGHRMYRKEVIKTLQVKFTYPNTDFAMAGIAFPIFLILKILENNFRIIEIPITYKKRVGQSKVGSSNFFKNVKQGFKDIGVILKY